LTHSITSLPAARVVAIPTTASASATALAATIRVRDMVPPLRSIEPRPIA
jgi:hypothetical protein